MTSEAQDRREGRGRLSSLDMLPPEADDDIVWAIEQLRGRSMPQRAICIEFNKRLADKAIPGISKSAFSRMAVRKAKEFRRMDEVRLITGEIVRDLGVDGADQLTIAVAEMIKVAAYEILEDGAVKSKDLKELGHAVNAAVNAQAASSAHRRKLEERAAAQIEQAADKVEKVATEAGMSAERAAQMRREVLGLRI